MSVERFRIAGERTDLLVTMCICVHKLEIALKQRKGLMSVNVYKPISDLDYEFVWHAFNTI